MGGEPVGLLDWFDAAAGTRGSEMLLVSAPAPRRVRRFQRRTARPGTTRVVLGAVTSVALIVGAVAAFGGGAEDGSNKPAAPLASPPALSSLSPSSAEPVDPSACGPSTDAGVVRGNGAGGTGSGPEAILAFEHAYYVARSGEQARAVVAADAAVSTVERLQTGIDSVPLGTTYCVTVREQSPATFAIELSEMRPGLPKTVYQQQITTTVRDGRTLITGISAA
ncbi:hypothetical protein [Nocardia sp. CA-120079]|uniref:hypothetical protein n=1 Tax=Nocardia sp. CA-120079 TaxID=3239974 RepID=UPI003D99693E